MKEKKKIPVDSFQRRLNLTYFKLTDGQVFFYVYIFLIQQLRHPSQEPCGAIAWDC